MKNIITILLLLTSSSFAHDKLYFIQKAAKTLRNGKTITNPQELAKLKKLTKPEIFDYLIDSEDFYFTVLKFNLFFLQVDLKTFSSTRNSTYVEEFNDDGSIQISESATGYSQAIRSAHNLKQNGNYLDLLGFETTNAMGIRRNYYKDRTSKNVLYPTPADRQVALQSIETKLEKFLSWVEQNPQASRTQFCQKSESIPRLFPVYSAIRSIYSPIGAHSSEWFPLWDLVESRMHLYCNQNAEKGIFSHHKDIEYLLSLLRNVKNFNQSLNPQNYVIRKIDDIKFEQFPLPETDMRKLTTFFLTIDNSSTNYSRKRAAYTLSTYFCDNLTPIAFVSPQPGGHSGDRHASDKACMACHYKLDPMAGFFKNHGIYGLDFKHMKKIMFSDGATMDVDQYQSAWAAPKGSQLKWNIGYIRSHSDQSRNEYGENIDDLYKIIQTVPEVKSCLVKKMFSYFVGDQVTIDQDFERKISQHFISQSRSNSSHAFKSTLKKMILSNSFMQKEIHPGKCYDFVPGSNIKNKPPCEINAILKKNCVLCHSSSDVYPFLNFTQYKKNQYGKMNFVHKDSKGKDRKRSYTLGQMKMRISTSDPRLKMPKNNIYFSSSEREKLFKWLEKAL